MQRTTMKSFIRWVWLWGLLPLQAYGQSNQPIETTDRFVIADTELMPGGKETTFTVGVEGSRIYTAYNMEIELPEGLAYAPNAKGSCVAKYTKDGMYYYDDFSEQYSHELSSAIISNGNLRVICISLSNENFEKESGGLFRVLIKASPYVRPGNAEIRMFGLNLTTASPVQKYIPEGDLNTGTVTVGNEASVPVNISATNQYGTCILPFALDALPEGLEAYTVASIEADVLRLTPATSVEAYTPYILYAGNGFSGTLTGTVDESLYPEEKSVTVNGLTGVIAAREVTSGFILQNQGDGVKFHPVGETPFALPEGRCYLSEEITAGINLRIFRDVTGIIDRTACPITQPEQLFDLAGRRVQHPQSGRIYISSRRGVFIQK